MPARAGLTIVTAGVWTAGAWAAWNGAVFAWSGTLRHRAEAAWFIFAGVLLVAGVVAALGGDESTPADPAAPPLRRSLATAMGFVVVSLILYGRSFGAGLLSDDFVLLERAERLSLLDPAWSYMRPLPLLAWWMVSWSDHGIALHAINILLHGLNAWLVYRIAIGARLDARWAAWAGALFLSWPTQVEAVAWASGVFDVMMTSFVLLSVLNVQDSRPNAIVRIARGVALAIAAMACKETAAALPILLVTVWPLLSSPAKRSAIPITAAVAIVTAIYAAARLIYGATLPGAASPSGYELKELISRPFGAMALNLHEDAARLRLLPVAMAIAWPALLAWKASAWQRDTRTLWLMLAGASWLMASVLPLLTSFYIGPDLQQSRYLYLGAAVWSIALVAIAIHRVPSARGWMVTIAVALVVIINGALVIAQQGRWLEAAAVRDQVLHSFAEQPIDCDPRLAEGLPDHVGGAYVFRNGFAEAIARSQAAPRAWQPCVARWDGARFVVRVTATFEPPAARPPLSFHPRRD
jgi:hypothetical protein